MKVVINKSDLFFAIWIRPREVIRKFISGKNESIILAVVFIWCVLDALEQALGTYTANAGILAERENMRAHIYRLALNKLIHGLGPGVVLGVGQFYLFSWLFSWALKKFGRKIQASAIRIAQGGLLGPAITFLLLWEIPLLLAFHFSGLTTARELKRPDALLAYSISGWIEIAIGIWMITIYIRCLSEVAQLRVGKTVLAVVVSWLPLLLLVLVWFLFPMLLRGVFLLF